MQDESLGNVNQQRPDDFSPSAFALGPWMIALFGVALLLGALCHGVTTAQASTTEISEITEISETTSMGRLPAMNAATPLQSPTSALCETLNAVTQRECAVLVVLYENTNGPAWQTNTNWLQRASAASPCDWAGVRCAGGHVTQLLLANNGLQGALPTQLGGLPFLTRLLLANNQLSGSVPLQICELVDTVQLATFDYNQLYAENERIAQCLHRLQPGWQLTQTTAPRDLRPTRIATDTLQLSWTAIPYSADGGYYEISYAPVITTDIELRYRVHGVTADKLADTYTLDGLAAGQTYRVRLRTFTPAHDGQSDAQWSNYAVSAATTKSDADPVLVLIYFPADNDLSPYIPSVVRRVQLGTRANPNVNVAMFVDAQGDHNTAVLHIANGEITRTRIVQEAWGTDELDSTDPETLTWFLQSARSTFPASRTVVSLMGHGSGMTPEVVGETFDAVPTDSDGDGAIPALPKTIPATPGDYENNGGYLSTADFAQALGAATDNGANPFDVVFFDQCFQGNLDVLYEFHTYADVFVASPNYAWLAAPYHRYLIDFTPTATAEQMAESIIVHYQAALTNAQPNVIFWVRGADIPPIAAAVSALGDRLQQVLATENEDLIAAVTRAAQQSQYVDTTQCGRGNLHLGQPDELLGAGSFAQNLMRGFDNDALGLDAAAAALLTELDAVHSLARTGRPTIAPDQIWTYTDTLTILAPLARRTMSHAEMIQANVWRASIYGTAAPLAAVSAGSNQPITVTSVFAFANEGRWDDFVASWYTTPLTPTVGTHCSYMPPALVRSAVTETLALTVTEQDSSATGDTITADWTATTATAAESYWLLVRPIETIRWQLFASVPLTQTTYLIQKPEPGIAYELIVVAQTEEGRSVAESNQVRYATVGQPVDRRIYLPVISR